MNTSFHIFSFICEIGMSGFTLTLNGKSGNSGQLFFLLMTKEKNIIGDEK